MTADVQCVLHHDGALWVCRNESLTARGATMLQLDQDIQRVLRATRKYQRGSRLRVFMAFDFATIPTWLRQYHSHYFNRTVSIDI